MTPTDWFSAAASTRRPVILFGCEAKPRKIIHDRALGLPPLNSRSPAA
jgi:hypothetical protein